MHFKYQCIYIVLHKHNIATIVGPTAYCNKHITLSCTYKHNNSGVARAFPGGRVAHPEGQNEEENK